MITPYRAIVLPRIFKNGVAFSGGRRRYVHVENVKIFGWLFWACYAPRSWWGGYTTRYKPKAIAFVSQFVNVKEEEADPAGGTPMLVCRSKQDGSYVGLIEDVLHHVKRYGITEFYRAEPDHNVASVGWAPHTSKWYGWSHRAIFGFAIGHVVEDGAIVRESGTIEGHPRYDQDMATRPEIGFKARTFADCRMLAGRFAESVG